jgi:putative ABC transport system permease protein
LTSIGGGIGIGLGFFLAQVIGSIIKIPVVFSLLATMIGFFFSVGIGIIAGFYPAFKASRLNPIEALRFE